MRLLDGCVATAASDTHREARLLLQGSFCIAVVWPRSLFASVDAVGATSCHLLVPLSSDLSMPHHSGHARNGLPTFGRNGLPTFGLLIKVSRHSTSSSSGEG